MNISVTQSYQDKDNRNDSKKVAAAVTSSQKKEYNEKLMFYVYELVTKAFLKKNKENLYSKDLNSVNLLLEAQQKADESLRRSLI